LDHRAKALAFTRELQDGTPVSTITNERINAFFYDDSPSAHAVIESGIRQMRNAGFSLYGAPEAPTPNKTAK